MRKTINISPIGYKKVFEPLSKQYEWDIKVDTCYITGQSRTEKTIETETPVFKEILANLESQKEYIEQFIQIIKEELDIL